MNGLPTELDDHILEYLDQKSLLAFLKTSRYNRHIAEPYLYRDLTFSDQQYRSISLLFNTIVDRRELAGHIHSFTLTSGVYEKTLQNADDPMSLQRRLPEVRHLLEEVVPPSSEDLTERWLGQLLADAWVIDGKVAMILCLADNIEAVAISTNLNDMRIIRVVLDMPWIEVSATDNRKDKGKQAIKNHNAHGNEQEDECDIPYPFHKLKKLSVRDMSGRATYPSHGEFSYSLLPFQNMRLLCSLTTLILDDRRINAANVTDPNRPFYTLIPRVLPAKLQSLSITNVRDVQLAYMCQIYAEGHMQDAAVKSTVDAATALRLKSFDLYIHLE